MHMTSSVKTSTPRGMLRTSVSRRVSMPATPRLATAHSLTTTTTTLPTLSLARNSTRVAARSHVAAIRAEGNTPSTKGPIFAAGVSSVLLYCAGGQTALVPAIAATLLTAALCELTLPLLRAVGLRQAIREDGPSSHAGKAGTPTAGGLIFIPLAILVGMTATSYSTCSMLVGLAAALFGLLGLIDDALIARAFAKASASSSMPRGMPAMVKLVAQIAISAVLCYATMVMGPYTPYDAIPLFQDWCLYVGTVYWALSGVTLVAQSNAVNLTDGMDALAGGASALAFSGMALAVSIAFPALVPLCSAFAGACIGFLALNRRPARLFMGNTGALALGGALAMVGVVSKMFLPLLFVSGVFAAEALSVLLQVGYYKMTKGEDGKGKRLFRMAPLHHHFELEGFHESKVAAALFVFGAAFAAVGGLQGLAAPLVVL